MLKTHYFAMLKQLNYYHDVLQVLIYIEPFFLAWAG